MSLRRALLSCALPLLAGLALAAPPASAAPVAGTTILAQRGLGNVHNSYAWGMAWFKGSLYVGTGRYVACVEAATTDFYFPVAGAYRPFTEPSQHCPRNRWNMDLRAEIWRYTPGTESWKRVYRSPTVPNPAAPGKRIARDIAYRGMSVHRDPAGHEALFVSGVSPDEIVPELARDKPPRLLRTYDGLHFHDIARSFVVNKTGQFADHRVVGFRGLTWWRNRLYVLASTGYAGDGSVYEVLDPWRPSRPSRFRQISPANLPIFEMEVFDGDLYIGAGDRKSGYSVWKTKRTSKPFRFKPIVTGGAGRGPLMTGVIAMQKFRSKLYVTAVSWYATPEYLPASEMIRISRDDTWQVAVGRPRKGPDGIDRYPLSGLMDGFNNAFVPHIWRMATQGGGLYAGTLDWSYLLQKARNWTPKDKPWNVQFEGLIEQLMAGELGFDLWTTCDGIDWFKVTKTAFGVDPYDFGIRTMVPGPGGNLYIGTADHGHGARVFDHRAGECVSRPKRPIAVSASAAAIRPRELLTDVQKSGTVLSWQGGVQGVRYEVQRSSTTSVGLSFRQPTAMPDGWWFDGQLPELAPVGSPGSTEVAVPLPGAFQDIGTTSGAYFVDRTRKPGVSYTYRVLARGPGGVTAESNVQTVPDPRPVATFQALQAHLPVAGAAAAADAGRLWGRKERAAALAEVERIRRTSTSDAAVDVARRLARRLQYAGVAERG